MPHPPDIPDTQWLSSLDKIMPKQRVEKFIRDLAAAKPVFAESIVPAATSRQRRSGHRHHLRALRFDLQQAGANLD